MTELLTAAQMRAIEGAAIDSGEVSGLELMERAGRGVVDAVFARWPALAQAPHRAMVWCGPGNNGGDGFVIARLLHQWGWQVDVALLGDPDNLPPDARANCRRWQKIGAIHTLDDAPSPGALIDLHVDALFGTGLTRPLGGELPGWAETLSAAPPHVVAVDIPSGLCSDSGRVLGNTGAAVVADLTVTFHSAKPGHYLQDGPDKCGALAIHDIGLPATSVSRHAFLSLTPAPKDGQMRKSGGHKYGHGHALVLSGGSGRSGAARLAARGALRIGAGLVTLGVPGSALQEVACQITALMLRRVEDGDGLDALLTDDRLNALCLGPGLGVDRARDLVSSACAVPDPGSSPGQAPGSSPGRAPGSSPGQAPGSSPGRAPDPGSRRQPHPPRKVVLDADALTAFSDDPGKLFEMLHAGCVLTPHDGEFKRLFPDIADRLRAPTENGPAYSRADATREAAARAGCVVLLKGPDTVIAAPDGRCSINAAAYARAAPWLATAGAGDVLAGFIAGLMARGLNAFEAAEAAVWLHVACAHRFGPGLIAEDLPEELPDVLSDLAG